MVEQPRSVAAEVIVLGVFLQPGALCRRFILWSPPGDGT